MAIGPGTISLSLLPSRASRTSSRSNHLTSVISSASIEMFVVAASAWQPIISDDGNGQGWEEW